MDRFLSPYILIFIRMKKMYIYANWADDIKKTWSGTGYALLQGLSMYYNTKQINIKKGFFLDLYYRFARKTSLFMSGYYYIQNHLMRRRVGEENLIFMISEVLNINDNQYVFFDNIWQSVYFFRELTKSGKYQFSKWSFDNVFAFNGERQLEYNVKRQYEIMLRSKVVFVMGEWLKEYIGSTCPNLIGKIYAVGGGVNTPSINLNLSKETGLKLLFVGRDFYRKGGDLVVESYYRLKKRLPNCELIVAGPNDRPDELDDTVTFMGDVDNRIVGQLMTDCDVFCMPSRFEAYGLVFIEALLHGMPVVARNAFEMPYFVENHVTGELIDKDDVVELEEALYRVLTDANYRNAVFARQDTYKRKYDWDNVCANIHNIIEKHENK